MTRMRVHKDLLIAVLRAHPEEVRDHIPSWNGSAEQAIAALEADPREFLDEFAAEGEQSAARRCEACGDLFGERVAATASDPDPVRRTPESDRHPGYCVGCAADVDDPCTQPGGFSS